MSLWERVEEFNIWYNNMVDRYGDGSAVGGVKSQYCTPGDISLGGLLERDSREYLGCAVCID